MISPIRLIQRAQDSLSKEDAEAFIEELFIRRELAHNYVYYQPHYDSLAALPDWARKTMSEHAADERPVEYSMEELEQSLTEDPYWNAAMKEMRETGYMHNYMRMYWGKKILEWSPGYEEALDRALTLNNRYFLDGRDANSYASNLWIYGLHDRAWQENPVFGKLRIMKQSGLKRKLDPEGYVTRVNRTAARIASSDGTR
jgi:deoxyribodipyrimidine photo-lyase